MLAAFHVSSIHKYHRSRADPQKDAALLPGRHKARPPDSGKYILAARPQAIETWNYSNYRFSYHFMKALPVRARNTFADALAQHGLRPTRQRELVFSVLLDKRDHPTADEVYARARTEMASISLATVYNCLETLVSCSLVRAVNYEREPTRFCPNLLPHAHFLDKTSGRIYDVDLPEPVIEQLRGLLPDGYHAESVELHFHGHLPEGHVPLAPIHKN